MKIWKSAKKHPVRYLLGGIVFLQMVMLVFSGYTRGCYVNSYDGIAYYVWLRSPVVDGDVQFKNDYILYNPQGNAPDPNILYPETKNTYNHYSAGMAYLCAPGFLTGHLLSKIFNWRAR